MMPANVLTHVPGMVIVRHARNITGKMVQEQTAEKQAIRKNKTAIKENKTVPTFGSVGRHAVLLCIAIFLPGCSGMQKQKTTTIELEGNPTTGYTWVCTISPEGIVRGVSDKYIAAKTSEKTVGSGGKFVYVFEALAAGEAELVFSYLRPWEEDIPPLKTLIYKVIVDDNNNLTLIPAPGA